jgi:hypothetical protein
MTFISIHSVIMCVVLPWRTYEMHPALSLKSGCDRFAANVTGFVHYGAAPRIYDAVMGCPNFTRTKLMLCLNHLMQNKATTLVFVGTATEDKDLWLRSYLGSQNYYC